MNYNFVYTNIKHIDHNYSNNDTFTEILEDFMNIRKSFKNSLDIDETPKIIDVSTSYSYVESKLDLIDQLDSYKYIKKIFFEDKVNPYELETFNVAVHIRRPNIHDSGIPGCYTVNNYVIKCINYIKDKHNTKNIKFHIYSQGIIDNFSEFFNKNVVFHLNESIEETFLGFIYSDVLIMATSSLSYVAALLTDGEVVYPKIYHHKPKSKWIVMD
jgi:hypothetical protein